MNPTVSTSTLFSSTRSNRALGLVVAGAIFAVLGLGGSGAIVRNFVTAGTYASAAAPAAHPVG